MIGTKPDCARKQDPAAAPEGRPIGSVRQSRDTASFFLVPHLVQARGRSTWQGLPAATVSAGTSLVTTEQAPTTLRAPIVTPGMTKARAPMKASSPIVI